MARPERYVVTAPAEPFTVMRSERSSAVGAIALALLARHFGES